MSWNTRGNYSIAMAHLKKLPTYFVKDGDRKKAYYTVDATKLRALGYVEEGEKAAPAVTKPVPEVTVEAGGSAFDMDDKLEEASESLDEMTKAELLDWALDRGHDLKNALPKREILEACKEIEAAL